MKRIATLIAAILLFTTANAQFTGGDDALKDMSHAVVKVILSDAVYKCHYYESSPTRKIYTTFDELDIDYMEYDKWILEAQYMNQEYIDSLMANYRFFVYFNLSAMDIEDDGRITYEASLFITTPAVINYNNSYTSAIIYDDGTYGYCHKDDFRDTMNDVIEAMMDNFYTAHKIANP